MKIYTREEIQKIRPLKDWCLIQFFKEEKVNKNGIYIPTKKTSNFAVVLKSGPGRRYLNSEGYYSNKYVPNTLKPGDVVYITNPNRCTFLENDTGSLIALCPEPFIELIKEEE